MSLEDTPADQQSLRARLHEVIFEADTRVGKVFDVVLIWAILLSVIAVMLDSVSAVHTKYGSLLYKIEWGFTAIFTVEYLVRLICVQKPLRYARSFFGIVDLVAVLPTYISMFAPGSQYLLVIRVLRVLRVFRVLKLAQYLSEGQVIMSALRGSRRKIFVFISGVMTLVVIFGAIMYLVEGEEHGFTSIPRSIYWAVVTMTTVGYGDISPETTLGQTLSIFVMLLGYAIIAVPTGIVSVEMANASRHAVTHRACIACGRDGHDDDALHCKFCGRKLE